MRSASATSGVTAPLARAWPETLADPALAARYAEALDGLDPASVEKAVATLGAKGRPAPPPEILRSVIISWQQAAATTVAMDHPAAVPAIPARVHTLLPVLAPGLLLAGAAGFTRDTWMSVSGDGPAATLAGADVRGGTIVAVAGILAALLSAIGAFLVVDGAPAARRRTLLGLLALCSVGAVFGAMTGLMRVSEIANRLTFDTDPGARGVTASAGMHHAVTVAAGSALWTTLFLSLAATALAVQALLALRRA